MRILTDVELPAWAETLATLCLGAGAARILAVWLENRRLSKREFRETLLGRIRELEAVVGDLQTRVGNLRVAVAHLEEENEALEHHVGRLEAENGRLRARQEARDANQGREG